MARKRKKRRLKKEVYFLLIIIIILIIAFLILKPKVLVLEDSKANIDNLYIYGQYLSLSGTLKDIDTSYDKIDLVLYNGKFKSYKLNVSKDDDNINFSLNNKINRGLFLDDINNGKYNIFIRTSYLDDNSDKYKYKYYVLNNKTDYKETTYYTMSNYNKKIVINSNNKYSTIMFNITNNDDNNIYDIVIDPGHGGIDSGTTKGKYTEDDIVMDIAQLLANKLEKEGLKVKLTRTKDSLDDDEYFDEYNKKGRAVIPHEVHAKYLLSMHINSNDSKYVNGIELYTANNIDYTLSKLLISNITKYLDISTSTKEKYKEADGIYTHNFSKSEINNLMKKYDRKGYTRYKVTTNSNYLYMIRETGGIATGAYVDDSNPDTVGINPYYNSNVGIESYLLELGYITNSKDLKLLTTKQVEYAKGIAKGIIAYLNK